MPLEEPNYETRSIDEVQYGKETADKIKATLACPEQVESRYCEYFKQIERPISDFFTARWGNDIGGMQTIISDDLRPDIANELREAIAKVWAV